MSAVYILLRSQDKIGEMGAARDGGRDGGDGERLPQVDHLDSQFDSKKLGQLDHFDSKELG